MTWFHRHTWFEQTRHFIPGTGVPSIGRYRSTPDAIERLVWGLTVVTLCCKTCGDLKTVEIKGSAV